MYIAIVFIYGLLALTSDGDDSTLHEEKNDHIIKEGVSIQFLNIQASSVLTVFFNVSDSIFKLLASYHVEALVDVCKTLMASNKHIIKLFSDNQMRMLKECDMSLLLLQRLSLFFTWSNHSVLRVLADQCSKAVKILNDFDCNIDPFELIPSYPIPNFSKSMIPVYASTHTILAIRCNQELYECTLQYVYDIQSVIMEKCDMTQHCLQLLAVRSDPTILYWTIPKCVVWLLNANITLCSDYLQSRGILEVLIYPELQFTFGDLGSVGLLAFSDDSELVERKVHKCLTTHPANLLIQYFTIYMLLTILCPIFSYLGTA